MTFAVATVAWCAIVIPEAMLSRRFCGLDGNSGCHLPLKRRFGWTERSGISISNDATCEFKCVDEDQSQREFKFKSDTDQQDQGKRRIGIEIDIDIL
jgi:hypothetical protein